MNKYSKKTVNYQHRVKVIEQLPKEEECLYKYSNLVSEMYSFKRCENCQYYFDYDCKLVDKNSNGDDKGVIHPFGVCDLFCEKKEEESVISYWLNYFI